MAAILLSPLPINLSSTSMSTSRRALSSIPHAVNSPLKTTSQQVKQKRSYASTQRDDGYDQGRPAKKQMLDTFDITRRTPPRQILNQSAPEQRILTRKPHYAAHDRRTIVSREPQQIVKKTDRVQEQDLETIRKWQKHYQKIFPSFVFYFESVPEDVRLKYTKHVLALGAREVKFFSKEVTHVVTTRPIPDANSSIPSTHDSQAKTVNPAVLTRSTTEDASNGRSKSSVDDRSSYHQAQQPARSSDVLIKARALGMKIWALEKLQRMMITMFEHETGDQAPGPNTRSQIVSIPRSAREADLSKLLRNERINGPVDRDPTVASKEMIMFKGPFIYIHDIDDKQKPIMVREYAKVQHKEHGDWPQFRSVSNGKCPFVGEVDYEREEAKAKERARAERRQAEIEAGNAPRTRAASVAAELMQPPKTTKRVFAETNQNLVVSTNQLDPFAPPKFQNPSSTRSQNAFVSRARASANGGRFLGGEPVASGVQPNITSAIKSSISSTAAQPGARVGTNKEFFGLQRQVLEKNSGGPASYGHASSHRATDLAAATRDDGSQQSRRRQHSLARVEEGDHSEDETATRTIVTRRTKSEQQRRVVKKDAKPGYCENCQDKFEDFDEHVISHKHRRFAEKLDNWRDLDRLLSTLIRPMRPIDSEDDY